MPIVFKKHFGDSDDDNDNDAATNSFLGDADDIIDTMEQPASKKRKLNTEKALSINHASNKNSKKKTKSMLKRLRIKKKKANRIIKNDNNKVSNTITSLEAFKPDEKAIEFQKIFLKTLKTSAKDLEFTFKPSHFIQISRDIDPIDNNIDIGSLDVLQHFLNNYYENIVNDDKEKENDDEQNGKNATQNKAKNEWIPFTKSMQIMIISPSVRKAVDTIKSIQKIKVKHSFIHKKQLEKMDAEEYAQYELDKDTESSVIPLRVCELFGKHRKIEYQQKELLNKSWHCGVGGINRINKLMTSKHLTLKKCELIIIDLQRNAKNLSILDMPPICKELCQWFKQYAFKRISNKHTKIAFF